MKYILFYLIFLITTCNSHASISITPNKLEIETSSVDEMKRWNYHFESLQQFVQTINQPGFEILKQGETSELYYAIIRHTSYLIVAAWPITGDGIKRSRGLVEARDGKTNIFSDTRIGIPTPLVSASVKAPRINGVQEGKHNIHLFGYSFPIRSDFSGHIKINYDFWTPDDSAPRVIRLNIEWK